MLARKYTFSKEEGNSTITVSSPQVRRRNKDDIKKRFKKELLEVFRKFGYLGDGKDYEIKIRTTSGNVAWININSIEVIK